MPRLVNGERKITNPKPENAGKLLIFCEGHTEYNYAEDFLRDDENASKYLHYEKHLVFDCDAPQNIQDVITLMMESENKYILDYSNLLFETWLVMHFQNIEPQGENGKRAIIGLMRDYLDVPKYTTKEKAEKGTIGKILGSNGNEKIRAAIDNAKVLEQYWEAEGKQMDKDIVQMNPSVNIYKLIERLLDEIVYLCK